MRHISFISMVLLIWLMAVSGTVSHAQCTEQTGRTERESYRSVIASTTMHYTIYLPPCYDQKSETYPAIYLMHGSAQYDDHWLQIGLDDVLNAGIATGEIPPMIVVLPYGEWIANENRFDQLSFERVFIEEMLPAVESTYRVSTERDTRAIGGISRGGFWAFEIAFRYPELFVAVGGHSAFFDRFHAPEDYNPLDLALSSPDIDTLNIWLDRGAQDYARPGLDLMDERLRERGIDYTYVVNAEGEHDNRYWSTHVAEYVDFYVSALTATPPQSAIDTTIFEFVPPRATPDPTVFEFSAPKAQDTPTIDIDNRYTVFLPVVAFNSTRANIDSGYFWQILAGTEDSNFILDTETRDLLVASGIELNPARTVERNEIYSILWNDRNKFTILPFDVLSTRYRVLNIDNVHPLLTVDNYQLAMRSDNPNFDPDLLTTLTLSGVTAITRSSIPVIDDYGVQWASSGIAEYTTQVDFFHTSNEVSFTEKCPQFDEQPLGAFCSKAGHFPILEYVGVDVIELSGNHNNDYGYTAYTDTLDRYSEAGIYTIGGGKTPSDAQEPLILEHNGSLIAMIACNDAGPYYAIASEDRPGSADCKGAWLEGTLIELREEVDVIIVTVQHVEFEEYLPRQEIQFDFRQIADWGADVVAGTHAHKPQSFEFYNNSRNTTTLIHYGLGNLFFDQPFWGNSRFWMDTLFIYDGEVVTVDLFTGIIDEQARPRRMDAEEQKNFLEFMFLVNKGVQ
jgi:poly-gamma-glutamate synthesis protein (capsule biosynthesis protein)